MQEWALRYCKRHCPNLPDEDLFAAAERLIKVFTLLLKIIREDQLKRADVERQRLRCERSQSRGGLLEQAVAPAK
jgi:hypothetical protein